LKGFKAVGNERENPEQQFVINKLQANDLPASFLETCNKIATSCDCATGATKSVLKFWHTFHRNLAESSNENLAKKRFKLIIRI